jgi:O-antigen ligase
MLAEIKKLSVEKKGYGLPFYLVLLFLLFDYGRPQAFFPILGAIHPGWILQGSLFVCLFLRGKVFNFKDIQTKCFVVLILLMTLHIAIATNNYMAYLIWKPIVLYFVIYLGIVGFVDSFTKVETFIQIWLVINLVGALVGLKNGGRIPNSGFMGDENDFALVMNMATAFGYFMFLGADSLKRKLFYMTATGVFIAANVVSFSRGGLVGLLFVGFYCWYKASKRLLFAVVIAGVAGVLYFSAPSAYWDRVWSIKDEVRNIKEQNISGTGEGRWYAWEIGLRMFAEHPIIGVGQGNYNVLSHEYQKPEELLSRRPMWGRAAHSLYLTIIQELGLVGSGLFFCMLYFAWRGLKRLRREVSETRDGLFMDSGRLKFIIYGINGALFGFLTSATFISVFDYPHYWVLIAIATAVGNITKN